MKLVNANMELINVNLSLFDEPTAEPETPEETQGAPETAETVDAPEEEVADPAEKEAEKEPPAKDPEKAFEELIKGEFKSQFDSRVKKILDRRFKEEGSHKEELSRYEAVVDLLAHKYGTSDIDAITQKMEGDILEEMAYRNEMSPENYKRIMDAERIQRQRMAEEAERQRQQQLNESVEKWIKESESMKDEYPEFDLKEALQNDTFLDLVRSNVPVKTAYELANFEGIKAKIRKDAEEKVSKSIQAKKSRPPEAAKSGNKGTSITYDAHNLTSKQRKELAERAKRGEVIKL